MKLSVTVIAKVLACLILFIWLPQTAEAARRVLLGVYEGELDVLQAMESWQSKQHAVVNMFTSWCHDDPYIANFFEVQLIDRWVNGNVPMITWKPTLGDPEYCPTAPSDPTNDIEVLAVLETYDDYLESWAERLKTFLAGPDGIYDIVFNPDSDDRRVYLRLGHEMNGNWYEWSAEQGINMPADYINMWRHVKDMFDSMNLDANHVQWVWSVNNVDAGGFTAEQYYPGHNYVDWVAIDGYNFGDSRETSIWKTPAEVFNPMLTRMRALAPNKPLAITEVGSTTDIGTHVVEKADWITTFFNQAVNNNDVKMVVWFNEDKENDWAVFGGANSDNATLFSYGTASYKTYDAYRNAVATSHFVSSDRMNPRLLTNAQFKGR
jgi:hypothetical protein